MRVSRHDILAPANAVTLVGFVLTVYGSLQLQTRAGFLAVTVGRLLDVLDGPVARRTHTSRFGAVLDATVDKFTVVAITAGLLAYNLAPTAVTMYILLQNGFVASLNLIAARRHTVIETSRSGKYNIFLQMCSMILFSGAHLLSGQAHTAISGLAYVSLFASLPMAAKATTGYLRAHPRQHQA